MNPDGCHTVRRIDDGGASAFWESVARYPRNTD
jgi:hypothetical protein